MPTLLLTGFEPFLNHSVNPSGLLAERLNGRTIAGFDVVGAILPVGYDRTGPVFQELFARHQPQVVLLTGLAFDSTTIRLERVALNLDDAGHADNRGQVRKARPINIAGPVGYWSTLPLEAIDIRLQAAGFPVSTSRDAGGYLCNHLFYRARQLTEGTGIPCGFVHLPPLPEQIPANPGNQPPPQRGLAADRQEHALSLIIQELGEMLNSH
jgi:pyroglutamyl-peptidase